MSTTGTDTDDREHRRPDKAQYGLAAALAVVGAYIVYDASTLDPGFADDYLGPSTLPYIIGSALIVLAGLLAVATARGDRPASDDGEDLDPTASADWATVGKLVGVFVVSIALIDLLGWAITGALLFAGCAGVLGSRTHFRDLLIGAVLSVGSWYAFYVLLGVPIPAAILDGVL